MSYTRLSRKPLVFKSFTGLELTEFDIISKEIESKYHEHERRRLSNKKRKRDVGAGRPFKLKLRERFMAKDLPDLEKIVRSRIHNIFDDFVNTLSSV